MAIDVSLRRLVRERAGNRCEYCGCHQDELPLVAFHVEHIIARQHGGTDDESNLCLAIASTQVSTSHIATCFPY